MYAAAEPKYPNVVEAVEWRFQPSAGDVLKHELAVTVGIPAPSVRSMESDE